MRASELIGSMVLEESGAPVGRIHDLRITDRGGILRIAGLAVGGGRLAHAWGFTENRATGPWLLRSLTARSARAARFVPADRVTDWGPGTVRISGAATSLPTLSDEVQR